jgi:transcriptional regulator with XRE-family HTH domain
MMDCQMIIDEHRRGRRQHDVLVPIRSDRLRAAMELGDWTVTKLAKRLGKKENPQTVHYLAQGDGVKRCRASRRAALATLLEVTEDWLAGGDYGIPLPAVLPLLKQLEGSPRVMLAVGRLFERCYLAVERDLAKEPPRPDSEFGWNAKYDVHWFMIGTLAQFLTPSRWQLALGMALPTEPEVVTTPRTGPMPEMNKWLGPLSRAAWEHHPGSAPLDSESEATVLGLLRAWTQILRRWLDGASELNYERLRALAVVLSPAVGVILPQSFQARPPIEELPPAGPTSPYAAVDWPLSQSKPAEEAPGRNPPI